MRVIKTQINKNKPTFCEEEYADMDFWESFAMDVVQEEIGSKITIEIIEMSKEEIEEIEE